MTKNIIEIVETFLTYSDEKLEELSKKNQALKIEKSQDEEET